MAGPLSTDIQDDITRVVASDPQGGTASSSVPTTGPAIPYYDVELYRLQSILAHLTSRGVMTDFEQEHMWKLFWTAHALNDRLYRAEQNQPREWWVRKPSDAL